jgi:hypothetical protein
MAPAVMTTARQIRMTVLQAARAAARLRRILFQRAKARQGAQAAGASLNRSEPVGRDRRLRVGERFGKLAAA